MDFKSLLFERYFQKFLVVLSITALFGFVCKCYYCKKTSKKLEDIIMDLKKTNTVEDIQNYIEQLPCECNEESLTLQDLVEDLKKWSDDDSWQNFVKNVICEDNNGMIK